MCSLVVFHLAMALSAYGLSQLSHLFPEFPFVSRCLIDITSNGNNIYACQHGNVLYKNQGSFNQQSTSLLDNKVKIPIMKWSIVCEIQRPPTFVASADTEFRVEKEKVLLYESPEKSLDFH
jgi:hypothetical protein